VSLDKEGRDAEFRITFPVMAIGVSLFPLLLFLMFFLAGTSYLSLGESSLADPGDTWSMLIDTIRVRADGFDA